MLSGVTLNCHNGCHEFRFPIRQNCNQCVCHYQAQCRVHIHTVTQCWVGLALSTNQEGGEGVSILGLGRNVVISFRSHNSLWNCCFHVIQIYFQKARKSLLFRWKVKHSHYLPNTAHTEPDLCSFEGHFHLYLVWLRQEGDFCSDELIGVGQQIGLEYQNWFAVETLNLRPALSTTVLSSSVSCQYLVCFPISSCPRWSFAGLRLLSWWDHAVCPVPLLYFSKQPYNQPLNAHH